MLSNCASRADLPKSTNFAILQRRISQYRKDYCLQREAFNEKFPLTIYITFSLKDNANVFLLHPLMKALCQQVDRFKEYVRLQ